VAIEKSTSPPEVIVLTNRHSLRDSITHTSLFPSVRFIASSPENWVDTISGADAIFLGRGISVDEVLSRAPRIRWIHAEGAGVDRTLTEKLRLSDVILTNSAGVHGVPTAEHVLAMILAFARGLPALGRAQAQHAWKRPEGAFEVEGQTLAVIGLGAIGQTLARKAHGIGLRVLGVRRRGDEKPDFIDCVYGPVELDRVLEQADHVAICLPLTTETRRLFCAARFSHMKRGSYIYNIGRGAIIDSEALLNALASGQVAGAGLDVTDPEPLPPQSSLWAHPGVVITSHTSAISPKNPGRTLDLFCDNLARALRGDRLRNVVDKEAGY
jgi:phosphoglycerate dehydrogenase-like enzyme